MRLSTSLFVAFALATTVPLAVTGIVTRRLVRTEFVASDNRRLEWAEEVSRTYVVQVARDERGRLESLCQGDPLLDAALVRMARSNQVPLESSQLQRWTERQAEALGLDMLEVVDPSATVLASAESPGRAGERSEETARLAAGAHGTSLLASVTLPERGRTREALALLSACRATRAGATLTLLAGRVVGEDFAQELSSRLGSDVFVFVLDARRRAVGSDRDRWQRAQRLRRVTSPLENPDGSRPAWVTIAIDDARQQRAMQRLDVLTLGVIASGIVVSWLLGMLLARWIGRPLSLLAQRAGKVASGELDRKLDVKASGEVGDLVKAFNTMTHDLRDYRDRLVRAERIAAWRDIARRIAHEIKNPLFPIQTSIETMRKAYKGRHPEFDEIFEESTVMILEEVERLKRIVTEFSRFARLPKPKTEQLDVGELVSSVASFYAGQSVRVTAAAGPSLPTINADREQLTQVLHNLIQNAIDASGNGQSVDVEARPHEGGVSITVTDNGSGMPPEVLERVFEPYFTTKQGTGTGLGLAIVHRIVTDHGGTIDVASKPGAGSTFSITLTTEGPQEERSTFPPAEHPEDSSDRPDPAGIAREKGG